LVEHGLDQSFPVYALFVSRDEMAAKRSRLPTVPGYEWRLPDTFPPNVAILKLAPAGSEQTPPSRN